MTSIVTAPMSLPGRARLCSRENAHRLASRLFEERREIVRVVRTADPVRPYRVLSGAEPLDGEVELEIRDI